MTDWQKMSGLKQKVVSGALWVTVERIVLQVVGFAVGMVLARLLSPTDYGTVALLSIFFAVAGVFASCGFGNALIQKKDAGDLEFNSVFYMSLAISGVIYLVFFFAAPWIAAFYKVPVLCPVTRVSALSFIFGAINSVQCAELSRKMLFKSRFKISAITSSVSAVCGISFAYLGWGVWALVISSMLTSIASVFAYWFIIAWRPKLMFSLDAVKGLFSFGWKLSISTLLHTIYLNLYGVLIGKFYTPADLAFVNKGNSMPNLVFSSLDGTINSVSFPALSKLQDDKTRVVDAMRRMIQCSTFLVFPAIAMLSILAKPIILLLYGEQWLPAVKYVPIVCFGFLVSPFCSVNCNAILAIGRTDYTLKMEIIKKTSGILLTIISLQYGVLAFVLTINLIQVPIAVIVNTYACGRLFGYKMSDQFRDVAPTAGICVGMAACAFGVLLMLHPLEQILPLKWLAYLCEILATSTVGGLVFVAFAIFLRIKPMMEYANIILPILNKLLPRIAKIIERMLMMDGNGVH